MNDKKFHEVLEEVLKKNQKYVNQDGSLNRNEVVNDALKYSEVLLEYLYSNITLRDKFFMKLKDVLVFKQSNFIDFVADKMLLAGSYTKYKNKIGLSVGNSYLKKNQEVVLSFPFKDCVLEGGQIKGEDKKQEKFYNEILLVDEIDRLLDPKVISNAKRISVNGESNLVSFKKDDNGNIKDNLLIKGNNLLALHSLKEKFAGKVKLIYIDPPYNTGNDEFKYNDNFNHSTWLVFMKNRLQIAKELLREDGVIFVSIDDNEQAYLKILMDEIFGRENFVSNLIVESAPAGTQSSSKIAQKHSYCLMFHKSERFLTFNTTLSEDDLIKKYNEEDELGKYYVERLWKRGIGGKKEDAPSLHFPVYYNEKTNEIFLDDENSELIKIIPFQTEGVLGRWTWSKKKMKLDKNKLIVKKVAGEYKLHKKKYIFEDTGKLPPSIINAKIGRTELGSIQIKNVMGDKLFQYPKPEELISHIISITTKENDIVLDFFAGSGTTGAVAHKMNRQWIMVEQMDYIESITKVRLQKVIDGEQGGISKAVNWQGGGDFVYLELKKSNQNYIDKINNANNSNELITIKHEILEKAFIDYNIHINNLKKDDNEDFNNLSLDNQKELLIEILDKNQLYVSYSEREDTMFNCTKEEIKLSEDFNK